MKLNTWHQVSDEKNSLFDLNGRYFYAEGKGFRQMEFKVNEVGRDVKPRSPRDELISLEASFDYVSCFSINVNNIKFLFLLNRLLTIQKIHLYMNQKLTLDLNMVS